MRDGYYLAYRPPEDYSERRRLARELNALGAVRLHYSLWRADPKIVKPILLLLQGRHAIVLKRSRGIVPPSLSYERRTVDLGTVAIIAYRLPRWSSRKRAALSRAFSGLPAMKIGRCLYLVPHLKASKIATYQGAMLTSSDLFKLLEDEGIEVARLTHLRIVYPANQEPLFRALIERQVIRIERLNLVCRQLREAIRTGELGDDVGLRKLLSAYRLRYRLLKGIAFFLQREMGVDLRPVLKRAYVALTSCRVLMESEALS